MKHATTRRNCFDWKFFLCCGIFVWFVINLLQGIFTEIQEDEAYYALYGEHLAWGYFDHPPMVGLMTFLGSLCFSGNMGVRCCTLLASCLSLWVLWRLSHPTKGTLGTPVGANVALFLIIACSVTLLNIYGFVTTPDVPLFLFSALVLWVYQEYLQRKTWGRALLMGVLIACMVYSKYHALLFLFLIVLSNWSLLKDGKFYAACLLALLLLTPHLLWQVETDFPSIRYHLVQRNEPFRWSYVLEYLPNQLLLFNPFTFGAMVYVLIKHRADDLFERGLRFVAIGFFVFFWLMTLRGHVEPHWTFLCCIPVVVLLYRKSLSDRKLKRYIQYAVLSSLLLVVAMRVLLLTPLADPYGFHGKERQYQAIGKVAGDCPVVFQGSFQQPALYHFFTGKESSSLRSYYDRKTQFDLWQFDLDWQGRRVFVLSEYSPLNQSFQQDGVSFDGFFADRFQSANRLVADWTITEAGEDPPVFEYGDTIEMDFSIYNPYGLPIDFQHESLKMNLVLMVLDANKYLYPFYDPIATILPQDTYRGHLKAVVNESIPQGKNRVALGIGDRIAIFTNLEHASEVIIKSPKSDRNSSY